MCLLCLTFSVLIYFIEYDRCLLNITCFSFPSHATYTVDTHTPNQCVSFYLNDVLEYTRFVQCHQWQTMLCSRELDIPVFNIARSLYACFLCLTFSVLIYFIEHDHCLLNFTCFSFPSPVTYVHCPPAYFFLRW